MPYDIFVGRTESDKKLFENKGLAFIGKGYVQMGQYTSLSNKIYLDVARSHVVLIAGKRGSGKSYSIGVIAEEISSLPKETNANLASLIFDTMGIYWTMKFQNQKDQELLSEWQLKSKNLPVKIFVPFGHFNSYAEKGIPIDEKFALSIEEMTTEDWIGIFNLNMIEPTSVLIQRIISKLKEGGEYFIKDIILEVNNDQYSPKEVKESVISLFEAAESWGVFANQYEKPIKIEDLVNKGQTTVIDLSVYNSVGIFNVRALVISLISKKIFNNRMDARKKEEIDSLSRGWDKYYSEKRETPLVWMFIDEAHEFLPKTHKTIATEALIQILREGRQPGISLVLATQQPGQIHPDVMTQSDIVIAHKVTSEQDISALNKIMQTYLLENIQQQMNELPKMKGSAIILDDNSERIYPIKIRPRFTWHGGESPSAVTKN